MATKWLNLTTLQIILLYIKYCRICISNLSYLIFMQQNGTVRELRSLKEIYCLKYIGTDWNQRHYNIFSTCDAYLRQIQKSPQNDAFLNNGNLYTFFYQQDTWGICSSWHSIEWRGCINARYLEIHENVFFF